jgi:hypothetical protein
VPSRQRLLLSHRKGDEHNVRYTLNRLWYAVRATCLWLRVLATYLGGKGELTAEGFGDAVQSSGEGTTRAHSGNHPREPEAARAGDRGRRQLRCDDQRPTLPQGNAPSESSSNPTRWPWYSVGCSDCGYVRGQHRRAFGGGSTRFNIPFTRSGETSGKMATQAH